MRKKKTKIRESRGDAALQVFIFIVLLAILIIVGYPVIYVLSCSFSSAKALSAGKVLLWPVSPTLAGYQFVINYDQVWLGYRNTIFYTVATTLIHICMTVLAAYPLSRRYYQGKQAVTALFIFTMLVDAGLIPTFIIKHKLGLYNSVWAVILAGCVSVNHIIILRTSFRNSIPEELFDAAKIDGASEFQCMVRLAVPLAKATISVIMLYAAVGAWNEYFTAMVYLKDENLYPLQLILRPILTASQQFDLTSISSSDMLAQIENGTEQIKYAMIVVSTIPVLVMYAVVQKFFEKGVMIGSVKG